MEKVGYVVKDKASRQYYCGPRLINYATRSFQEHDLLRICAHDELVKLRDFSNATVGISNRTGASRILILEMVMESTVTISMHHRGDIIAPIYTGASGLVLLSEMRDDELTVLFNNIELAPLGPKTI